MQTRIPSDSHYKKCSTDGIMLNYRVMRQWGNEARFEPFRKKNPKRHKCLLLKIEMHRQLWVGKDLSDLWPRAGRTPPSGSSGRLRWGRRRWRRPPWPSAEAPVAKEFTQHKIKPRKVHIGIFRFRAVKSIDIIKTQLEIRAKKSNMSFLKIIKKIYEIIHGKSGGGIPKTKNKQKF